MSYSDAVMKAADSLFVARHECRPCGRVSEQFGLETLAQAYQVQEINTVRALDSGRRLSGRKVGLTSKAVQQQLGVDQPDFGMLFSDMAYWDGDDIPVSQLIQPKIEAEIAFVLKHDLDKAYLTLPDILNATDYVLPALEIVDSAIADWNITLLDTVADNASSGLYVLGKTPFSIRNLDLALEGMVLERNGAIASLGVGAACLGNPLDACLWLARTMCEAGRPLSAGDVLLSGALGPMVEVSGGDSIRMRSTRLGDVRCHFV